MDSSVAAALIHKALGKQLTCVFVDTGMLRKNERQLVETTFRDHFHIDLRVVDAEAAFLADLAGITDPQEKRRRIGHRFIECFNQQAAAIAAEGKHAKFLAQGTLYPDVIESGHGHAGTAAGIKLHHNVGGLPADLGFQLVEPLRELFKDEVRKLGEVLGLPEQIIWRHPFPGPGLAVRILGEVTKPKLDLLRDCDEILLEEIVAAGLYRKTSQVFAVLLPVQSVGVMGDGRTYESVVAVRAVETQDFMTADWARIPYDVLARSPTASSTKSAASTASSTTSPASPAPSSSGRVPPSEVARVEPERQRGRGAPGCQGPTRRQEREPCKPTACERNTRGKRPRSPHTNRETQPKQRAPPPVSQTGPQRPRPPERHPTRPGPKPGRGERAAGDTPGTRPPHPRDPGGVRLPPTPPSHPDTRPDLPPAPPRSPHGRPRSLTAEHAESAEERRKGSSPPRPRAHRGDQPVPRAARPPVRWRRAVRTGGQAASGTGASSQCHSPVRKFLRRMLRDNPPPSRRGKRGSPGC